MLIGDETGLRYFRTRAPEAEWISNSAPASSFFFSITEFVTGHWETRAFPVGNMHVHVHFGWEAVQRFPSHEERGKQRCAGLGIAFVNGSFIEYRRKDRTIDSSYG